MSRRAKSVSRWFYAPLFLFAGLSFACDGVAPADAKPTWPTPRKLKAQPKTAEAPKTIGPKRLRAWPKLQAWYQGSPVDAQPRTSPEHSLQKRQKLGAQLFSMYCVNCHGAQGKGDGPRGPLFEPAPRDFSKGLFKFRSTRSGAAPTDEDLFLTISGGLRGTGMPSFADLSEADRWALVSHIRALSGREAPKADAKLAVPEAPNLEDQARVQKGAKLFAAQGCAQCHGAQGRGDGPASKGLIGSGGIKAFVPDFAVQPLKRRADAKALFTTLTTGLDGSPMPAYDALPVADRWALVAYVLSLPKALESTVNPEYKTAVDDFLQAQYAQSKHATIGGCGCQVGKIQNRLEAARTKMRTVKR